MIFNESMFDCIVYGLLLYILFGTMSSFLLLFILTIENGLLSKVDSYKIKSIFEVSLFGPFSVIVMLLAIISVYIDNHKEKQKQRETEPWWKLKEFGGWL